MHIFISDKDGDLCVTGTLIVATVTLYIPEIIHFSQVSYIPCSFFFPLLTLSLFKPYPSPRYPSLYSDSSHPSRLNSNTPTSAKHSLRSKEKKLCRVLGSHEHPAHIAYIEVRRGGVSSSELLVLIRLRRPC